MHRCRVGLHGSNDYIARVQALASSCFPRAGRRSVSAIGSAARIKIVRYPLNGTSNARSGSHVHGRIEKHGVRLDGEHRNTRRCSRHSTRETFPVLTNECGRRQHRIMSQPVPLTRIREAPCVHAPIDDRLVRPRLQPRRREYPAIVVAAGLRAVGVDAAPARPMHGTPTICARRQHCTAAGEPRGGHQQRNGNARHGCAVFRPQLYGVGRDAASDTVAARNVGTPGATQRSAKLRQPSAEFTSSCFDQGGTTRWGVCEVRSGELSFLGLQRSDGCPGWQAQAANQRQLE